MRKQIQGQFKSDINFMFGNDRKKSLLENCIELHGCRASLVVELIDSDIPMLISKPVMTSGNYTGFLPTHHQGI